jgi:hypothetical protein
VWLRGEISNQDVTIVGEWGDPFTEIVIDLVANIRANQNHEEKIRIASDEIMRFPQMFYDAKFTDRYADANGTIWDRPRDELNPLQAKVANDLQILANAYQSLRLLSLFDDWLMEFHCIPRYMWLYIHELDRQMYGDCFRFTEYDPVRHYLDVNAVAPIKDVTVLPWDESGQELFFTLMTQHVNRTTFCSLRMVVLYQMMGIKLTPSKATEIIT